ncbi:hypothetical protein QN277_026877 [Acacia crassicarpa]|uniref:Uncharacterized protein n=1 Tax=Acacia crassicarpa TaxID=499986 RepID=A0AAE1MMD4_9FABA|nr:hypothetical protein QN277_026877 [Acacia crassicarpa]
MAGLNLGGSQTISGSTSQHGEYKGHGIGARALQGYPGGSGGPTPLPVPVISEPPVTPAPTPVAAAQAPWWFNQYYYYNYGTSSIEGNTKQDGTFKGHGTGASIQGGLTASGDIK